MDRKRGHPGGVACVSGARGRWDNGLSRPAAGQHAAKHFVMPYKMVYEGGKGMNRRQSHNDPGIDVVNLIHELPGGLGTWTNG